MYVSRYQYPVGPVCDWPGNVLCVGSTQRPTTSTTTPDPGCITDDDCQDNEWCDTSGMARFFGLINVV